jgi:TonB family protein
VKTALTTSLLAASLLVIPATAADVKAGARPAPGPVMDAMQSAMREMQLAQDPRLPLPVQLDRVATMRYTPETSDKLRAVFGNDQPLTFERQPARPGRLAWRMRLQPLHYAGQDNARVDWDEAQVDFDMDKAGKAVDFSGHWNTLAAEDPSMRLSAEGITLSGRQRRSADKLWFGNGQLRIARVRGETPQTPNAGMDLTMEDLRMDWRTVERPKAIDMRFQQRIGSISAAGEKVEDIRFDMRIVNVDRAAMVALQAAGERQREQLKAATPEQQLAAMKPMLRTFGKAAIVRGSAIEIDEISARFHGNKASIRGRIGLVGAVEADLQDMRALIKKIVARFEIRVPVAVVRDVSGIVAARQAQQQGTAPNGMSVAQVGQTMTDVVVGKLLGAGYAKMENEVLVSTVEFRNGKLSANGKEIGLPTVAPAARTSTGQAPAAVQRSNLPPGALQARRIEDSCRLPDYPGEVVRQDQPLRASFAYRVDAEGKVHDVRVAAASGFPDWDQAALQALGQCRYIPALQDGKPIELQMSWSLVREAGSKRPRDPNPAP